MFDITSTEDITSYALRLQEIKEKMKQAGLLELFEEALEIQEGFKHLLALSNKNKKMLTAEIDGKRPVGRPRKVVKEVAQATQTKGEQEATQINQVATASQEKDTQRGQGIAKNEASPQSQGQDTQERQDTQTKQQQGLDTSKPSSLKKTPKQRGRKPERGS
ncbi:hypothetical protein [Helicobacter vulpis]|uniref:hypothetical protein n=1 Tax=Helicobacter vulpis TaxID=2316076 RepID=UPI000EAE0A28|nr:hypothetical protein [Helicobacter vulpis]